MTRAAVHGVDPACSSRMNDRRHVMTWGMDDLIDDVNHVMISLNDWERRWMAT